ncbi:hypothetical protein C7974DRAFT_417670 [Boeremia exigua]|uniref:uncharacterized protein n=1 Tax=Boeremia exigua TaxID=749465 RepID=UPI001E8D456E|nr:uncharacterized protein C7974DRAFT_417670 [Boeremia exigua]KAH6613926.1 hypothetical protein C7974DRAFT_417670 [Boeremia exigua]
MHIPHKDPNPSKDQQPLVPSTRSLQGPPMTWTTFHGPPVPPAPKPPNTPHWRHTTTTLQDQRTRFALHTSPTSPYCAAPTRRTILALYTAALTALEHASPATASAIATELTRKINIALDLAQAHPHDPVFYTNAAHLPPLEPQYAQPRLDADPYFYAGWGRLREWRREGWPREYPGRAVQRERLGRGKRGGREGDVEGLVLAMEARARDWGDEVDADPGRAWK